MTWNTQIGATCCDIFRRRKPKMFTLQTEAESILVRRLAIFIRIDFTIVELCVALITHKIFISSD